MDYGFKCGRCGLTQSEHGFRQDDAKTEVKPCNRFVLSKSDKRDINRLAHIYFMPSRILDRQIESLISTKNP